MKNSWDMCKGERKAPRWPTAIIQRPFACEIRVRASEVYFFGAMLDGVPPCKRWHPMERWGLTVCLHTVIKPGIRPCWVPSLTISLLLWSCPACRANRPNQAFISDVIFTFFCALWHPLIPLIPIWYQIIVTVVLLAKSGVLIRGYPPPWTSVPALTWASRSPSPTPPLQLEASACCTSVSCGLHHSTAHLTHQTVTLFPSSFLLWNTLGVICTQPGIVCWLLLMNSCVLGLKVHVIKDCFR